MRKGYLSEYNMVVGELRLAKLPVESVIKVSSDFSLFLFDVLEPQRRV